MAIDKNYRIGFRLSIRRDVSINDAIEAFRSTAPEINISSVFDRAKQLVCKAPISIYEKVFRTDIVEMECSYADFFWEKVTHNYLRAKEAKLPPGLEQYFERVESIGSDHGHQVRIQQE